MALHPRLFMHLALGIPQLPACMTYAAGLAAPGESSSRTSSSALRSGLYVPKLYSDTTCKPIQHFPPQSI